MNRTGACADHRLQGAGRGAGARSRRHAVKERYFHAAELSVAGKSARRHHNGAPGSPITDVTRLIGQIIVLACAVEDIVLSNLDPDDVALGVADDVVELHTGIKAQIGELFCRFPERAEKARTVTLGHQTALGAVAAEL